MKKKKAYIYILILTLVSFFTISSICNQCTGLASEDKETIITETEEEIAVEESHEEEIEEEAAEEESEEEEVSGEQVEAPTIELKIYEGPIYSPADDLCYYRVKAVVTGSPAPEVEFSKDDSGGAWGEYKTQININDPADTYKLTATAANSEGSAADSVNLAWGCNFPPELSGIIVDCDTPCTDETYALTAIISNPDGDVLSFKWSVNGGTIDDIHAYPAMWNTPAASGEFDITLEVFDANGGSDALTESFIVEPSIKTVDIPFVNTAESGYIEEGLMVYNNFSIFAGDTLNDNMVRGYISYDITGLADTVIIDVSLSFEASQVIGAPSFMNLWVGVTEWGPGPLVISDYDLTGVGIESFNTPSFICSAEKLKTELQKAIDSGKTRFQVRIHFAKNIPDGDGLWDGWTYEKDEVRFIVVYSAS